MEGVPAHCPGTCTGYGLSSDQKQESGAQSQRLRTDCGIWCDSGQRGGYPAASVRTSADE